MARILTIPQASRQTGIPESIIKDAIWRRELKTTSWFRRGITEDELLHWKLDHFDTIISRIGRDPEHKHLLDYRPDAAKGGK